MLRMNNIQLGIALFLMMAFSVQISAQNSRSFGAMHVPDNASMSIFSKHTFHDGSDGVYPGVISTSREKQKGFISFAYGSSWVGASDMQHVDGYVRVFHNDAFTFPIGTNGKFRPVAISGAARTSAAYFDSNPSYIQESGNERMEPLLSDLSKVEYWDIDGTSRTQVTLTWDENSFLEELTEGDLTRLTIIGWRGNQWELIPSSIDRFSLDVSSSYGKMGSAIADFQKGSITTNEAINPGDYEYITFGTLNPATMARVQPTFDVFPNPVNLTLSPSLNYQFSSNEGGLVRLYSPNNVLLLEKKLPSERGVINLENPINDAGVYVIGIVDNNGNSTFQKLVVVEE